MTNKTLTLAGKDLRLLLRDVRSAIILLVMPLVFVAVLGMAVGEGFGQKPDDRLRISVVNLDEGLPNAFEVPASVAVAGAALAGVPPTFPGRPWSEVVIDDLSATAGIRIEVIPSLDEARRLVGRGRRSAVLVFEPRFSREMHRCSFLTEADPPPLNPLYRDGIDVNALGLQVLRDETQVVASSIIEQVAQVTLLRVVIPWMIGKAFERVGDPPFMATMADLLVHVMVNIDALRQLAPAVDTLLGALFGDEAFGEVMVREIPLLKQFEQQMVPKGLPFREAAIRKARAALMNEFRRLVGKVFSDPAYEPFLRKMSGKLSYKDLLPPAIRAEVGPAVQQGVAILFSNYNFRAKTWAGLTRNEDRPAGTGSVATYVDPEGSGLLRRGAARYQVLVPGYTVMFAFFLVLTVGWLFVAERRQGTLVRLRAAPLTRGQILLGKLVPCLLVSLFQGLFLLAAGRALFGMSWGAEPLWLLPVVVCTSLAASGMAMLIAGVARTETQVAIYGTLLVLVLAGVSGSMMPRDLMPEEMRQFSYVTPHAWALDAYAQLLLSPTPDPVVVAQACGVLAAFGLGFLALAWKLIRLN